MGIKKVIKFLHPEGAKPRKSGGYSWVELVANRPQKPDIMISHAWSGRFKEFMDVIDELLKRKEVGVHTAIWVCTFANCQFGENFGTSLALCPFVKAVAITK